MKTSRADFKFLTLCILLKLALMLMNEPDANMRS
jgi:hypothetical protein